MVKDPVEDQEPGSVTILRRHADTHWLRFREKRRTEETGGALFCAPVSFCIACKLISKEPSFYKDCSVSSLFTFPYTYHKTFQSRMASMQLKSL